MYGGVSRWSSRFPWYTRLSRDYPVDARVYHEGSLLPSRREVNGVEDGEANFLLDKMDVLSYTQ